MEHRTDELATSRFHQLDCGPCRQCDRVGMNGHDIQKRVGVAWPVSREVPGVLPKQDARARWEVNRAALAMDEQALKLRMAEFSRFPIHVSCDLLVHAKFQC